MSDSCKSVYPIPVRKTPNLKYPLWGNLTVLDSGPSYQIKRFDVNPGQSLGSQLHPHLDIHWIVVAGVAKFTDNTQKMLLSVNQSFYVPRQTLHRIENPGQVLLTLMAVECSVRWGDDNCCSWDGVCLGSAS